MSLGVDLELDGEEIWSGNITHNLSKLAAKVEVYLAVWRPDENSIYLAEQMIEPLERAIAELESDPAYYAKFNASNGWGTSETLLRFLKEYLSECKECPLATIEVCR